MALNYEATRIGEKRLGIDGFLYLYSFKRKESTYWDCTKVRTKECKARAVTSRNHRNEITVLKGPNESRHSHPPNRDQVTAEEIKIRIKEQAKEHPQAMPSAIVRGLTSMLRTLK